LKKVDVVNIPSEKRKQALERDKLTNEIVKPQQCACKLAIVFEYDVDPRTDTAVNQL